MIEDTHQWLPLDQAAKYFGYSHPNSLRNRLRELRRRGKVSDLGIPPAEYAIGESASQDKVVIYWVNPKTALIRNDAPRDLLTPKRGKRALSS